MSWVWREQRDWGKSSCTRLITSGFASGALDYAEPGTIDSRAVRALYWPAITDSLRGAWNGPTYVLTDANTGSAAEMFSALMDRLPGQSVRAPLDWAAASWTMTPPFFCHTRGARSEFPIASACGVTEPMKLPVSHRTCRRSPSLERVLGTWRRAPCG
jgi:hypothetical protein